MNQFKIFYEKNKNEMVNFFLSNGIHMDGKLASFHGDSVVIETENKVTESIPLAMVQIMVRIGSTHYHFYRTDNEMIIDNTVSFTFDLVKDNYPNHDDEIYFTIPEHTYLSYIRLHSENVNYELSDFIIEEDKMIELIQCLDKFIHHKMTQYEIISSTRKEISFEFLQGGQLLNIVAEMISHEGKTHELYITQLHQADGKQLFKLIQNTKLFDIDKILNQKDKNINTGKLESLFESQIIVRGTNYDENNQVLDCIKRNDVLTGMVQSTSSQMIYQVVIHLNQDSIEDMVCNCPYEHHCKHEYALILYYRKHKKQILNQEKKWQKDMKKILDKKLKEYQKKYDNLLDEMVMIYFKDGSNIRGKYQGVMESNGNVILKDTTRFVDEIKSITLCVPCPCCGEYTIPKDNMYQITCPECGYINCIDSKEKCNEPVGGNMISLNQAKELYKMRKKK